MTTDFSQAIVNGFGIAAKWREMNQQEEDMRLTEAFRRDAAAEQKRQFNLGLAETKDARKEKAGFLSQELQLRRDDLNSQDRARNRAAEIDTKRLTLAERAMNEEKDQRDKAEENAYIGQLAQMKFQRERDGNPMSEQEQLQYFAGNPIGRRALKRAGLPTESVRDGTPFDTAVAGPNGEVTTVGRRADGTFAVADQGRTHDNRTPPFTMAPGNVTTLVTGAIMQSPEGIAAARQHAALTSNLDALKATDAEIQQALVAANADATARYNAAKEAEAKAQTTQPNLAQQSKPPSARSEFSAQTAAVSDEAMNDVVQGVAQGRPGLFLRGTAGQAANVLSYVPRAVVAGVKDVANSGFVSDTLGLASTPAQAKPPARPPLQEPAPITALDPRDPLMQRRAALLRQQEEASAFSRGLAMGYTPEQAGVYSTTGTPSESVAAAQLRELGDRRREYMTAEDAYNKRVDAGYSAISSLFDDMAKGDKRLESQRGAMTRIMSMSNVTTRGALGADPDMRAQYANNLVSLMRMGDDLPGLDPRYKDDILGAMAMKSINASSASTFDVNNPKQVKQVSENLNTLYRGVPEGISPKQQALLAELAASNYSPEEMARARDLIINLDPAKVDEAFRQNFMSN